MIGTVAVVGAGTMGHALALVHALGGCDVWLTDTDLAVLESAKSRILSAGATLIGAGVLEDRQMASTFGRIRYCPSLAESVEAADLIVEAVVEISAVKRELFIEIDRLAAPDAILASNSSYLDIFPLVPEARRSQSVVAHWYTPPYIIDLVDLVPAPDGNPGILDAVRRLYDGFGKTVLVFDRMIPGYIANRLQMALNLECLRMIDEEIATAEQIDLAVRTALAGRLALFGHMRKADYAGLEVMRNGVRAKMYRPPEVTGASPTLDRLIEEGRTGVGSGAGFYDYGGEPPERLYRERDIKLLKLKAALGVIEEESIA